MRSSVLLSLITKLTAEAPVKPKEKFRSRFHFHRSIQRPNPTLNLEL
jgi:hypothetical protein